jgi:hypothetical protein
MEDSVAVRVAEMTVGWLQAPFSAKFAYEKPKKRRSETLWDASGTV